MSDKSSVLSGIQESGVIAVVRVDSAEEAMGVTRALVRGGVGAIEISFNTPDAAPAIAALARALAAGDLEGEALLGAGTVTSATQAETAIEAGAQFLFSPCFIADVLQVAQKHNVVMVPGALTPTEIWTAYTAGSDLIKVFPASRFGPAYFEEIKAPFPEIPLIPTGGVDAGNAAAWIKAGAVALGVGGRLVDRAAVRSKQWDLLTRNARALVIAVAQARNALSSASSSKE